MKVLENKKIKYGIIGLGIILVASLIITLEVLSNKKEEQQNKSVKLVVTKKEMESINNFMGEFYSNLNNNDLKKAQDMSKVDILNIAPDKKEYPNEIIEPSKSYMIKKIKDNKYKIKGLETTKLNNDLVSKRESTYLIEKVNKKFYITKFNYEFEKAVLIPEIQLIGRDDIIYRTSHGIVAVIGENIDLKSNRFTIALKYTGSKPEEFVHTFAEIEGSKQSNTLKLIYAISDKGIKLVVDSTEVRRIDGDAVILLSGDAKEEKTIARIDYVGISELNNVLAGKVNLMEGTEEVSKYYAPLNLMPKDEDKRITLPAQHRLNIDIQPNFKKKADSMSIHIESITYDNIKGLWIKGIAISTQDIIMNFKDTSDTNKKIDQLKLYNPYRYQLLDFSDKSIYEKSLYQDIPSVFELHSDVKLTYNDNIVKLFIFNVPIYIDLLTGKEVQVNEERFKAKLVGSEVKFDE